MKNNIVIRIEEKSEYREVENLVRDSFVTISGEQMQCNH